MALLRYCRKKSVINASISLNNSFAAELFLLCFYYEILDLCPFNVISPRLNMNFLLSVSKSLIILNYEYAYKLYFFHFLV